MSRPSEPSRATELIDAGLGLRLRHTGELSQAGVARLLEVFAGHQRASRGGMAFTVRRGSRELIALSGGSVERRASPEDPIADPWTPETRSVLFSGTKGLVALLSAIVMDRGLLSPDDRVAEHWPEFAAGGKEEVRARHLLDHTVGLPYVEEDVDPLDVPGQAAALARQAPLWEPGRRVAYHPLTYGHLLSELLHRVTGRDVSTLLAEEVACPLGLDLSLGAPVPDGVAAVFRDPDYRISTFLQDPERRAIVDRMYASILIDGEPYNTTAWQAAGLAGAGGVGSSAAMAALYGHLAGILGPGPQEGLVSASALRAATRTWSSGIDAINDRPLRFGLGFELDDTNDSYGPVSPAFGHSGAGGGLHGAWPQQGIGFSFLSNEMRAENRDGRAQSLLSALAAAL